ncbi:MerR family transcriptional regulator [Streptomyces sp. MST-110588]|uniref:MerR family transcriptional regulator n=1 Tax=Streptomyces sp. MST-110588 TaxID=2833628 RepID=UPI00324234FA
MLPAKCAPAPDGRASAPTKRPPSSDRQTPTPSGRTPSPGKQAPTPSECGADYRIEDLAQLSGATVRTIRAYQDRGLLPRPERRGRANVYGEPHLTRLRQIADLLDRGYTLASIKELLDAWAAGRGLGGVLGLVAEVDVPWTDEQEDRITRDELDTRFGGVRDDAAVQDAVDLGVLERIPGQDEAFRVPSPRELAVAAELHSAGVPLPAISDHLREVRARVEQIASRFLEFTTEHVFRQYLDHPPSEAEATEAAVLVRRMRPLAQQVVDAELARAMRTMATRYLRHHLAEATPETGTPGIPDTPTTPTPPSAQVPFSTPAPPSTPTPCSRCSPPGPPTMTTEPAAPERPHETTAPPVPEPATPVPAAPAPASPTPAAPSSTAPEPVVLPAETVQAVRALVGRAHTAAFITAATQRELHARTMDHLASRHPSSSSGSR